jgi:predicted nucleotidyltransferase component of viral defense system
LSPGKGVNLPASVHRRLLNISRETGTDPNYIWSRYAMERLLYRLSVSDHAGEFALKGAMLFMVWTGRTYRPTYDLDLLGFGEDSAERLTAVFKKLCAQKVEPDGLVFDAGSVKVESIRQDQAYQGQRVKLVAGLGKARITIQVDVGFGDVITPKAEEVAFPALLDFPAPRVRACTRETVVAEKLHALAVLGMANSRMKDFCDLYVLAGDFPFDGAVLVKAIKATFRRRRTQLPASAPLALTDDFAADGTKASQWGAFVRKSGLGKSMPGLPEAISRLREHLLPPLEAAAGRGPVPERWLPGGPWKIS